MNLHCLLLGVLMFAEPAFSQSQQAEGFVDVPRSHWAYQAVTDLKQMGILQGYASSPSKDAVELIREGNETAFKTYLATIPNIDLRVKPKESLMPPGFGDKIAADHAPTFLMYACYYGRLGIVQQLLDRGASLHKKADFVIEEKESWDSIFVRFAEGITPLHLAASQGKLAVTTLLVKRGTNVNTRDDNGWTPLRWALISRQTNMLTLLLKHGANVNSKAKDGTTPLFFALEQNNALVEVEILLRAGADPNIQDNKGRTALKLAAKSGLADIYQRLKQAGAKGNIPLSPGGLRP